MCFNVSLPLLPWRTTYHGPSLVVFEPPQTLVFSNRVLAVSYSFIAWRSLLNQRALLAPLVAISGIQERLCLRIAEPPSTTGREGALTESPTTLPGKSHRAFRNPFGSVPNRLSPSAAERCPCKSTPRHVMRFNNDVSLLYYYC